MLLFGHLGTTLGAMIPDIIDKPQVLMLSDKPVGSARFIAHSFIFIVVLLMFGEIYEMIFMRTGLFKE